MTNFSRLKRALITAAVFVVGIGAHAETPLDSTAQVFPEFKLINDAVKQTHVVGGPEQITRANIDSIERLISTFYVDQYRHFQDPRAPYFMFMSKDANLAMGIGGVIRMRGWFDWDGSIPTNGFVPWFIPIPSDGTNRRQINATPAGTSVFLTILGRKTQFGNIMGFIQGGFDGYNNVGFKLKKAYLIVNDWTIGYAASTFVDPSAQPPTIDGAGPNGFTSKTQVLIRYFKTFKNRWSVGGGLEIPKTQVATDDYFTKKVPEYIPDVAAVGQYQWDQGLSHVRLSALLHSSAYQDIAMAKNYTVPGYGFQLSTTAKIIPQLSAYGQVCWGKGIGSYIAELSVDRYDLVPDPNKPGRMYAPNSFSYTLGARYFLLPNLYMVGAFGQMRYLPKESPEDGSYKYGLYAVGNVFWDMSPRIQVGIEYLHGRRMNFDHSSGSANRVDALFQFSF